MAYAIDLFCGAGGMSEGLIQAGFHILFSSDINKQVELTYKNRHEQLGLIQGYNTHFERSDIRELDKEIIMKYISELKDANIPESPAIDAIFGGPPCQGFSLAGKRKHDDPRNFLFKEYLRVVNEIRPKYVVMENVEGFMTAKLLDFIGVKGRSYDGVNKITEILLQEFEIIGYKTLSPKVLDASDFGVPQKRNRAIFIAYLPECTQPSYPTPSVTKDNKVTVLDSIGDLIHNIAKKKKYNPELSDYQTESRKGRTKMITGKALKEQSNVLNYEFAKHEDYIVERFSLFKNGEDAQSIRKRIFSRGISLKSKEKLVDALHKKFGVEYSRAEIIKLFKSGNVTEDMVNTLLTKKNNRIRIAYGNCSPTVVTLPDDYISPFENRIFTVREMARLQSFDDSFEFLGKRTTGGLRRREEVPQYSQVGNAVPPLLSKSIALEIIKAINS